MTSKDVSSLKARPSDFAHLRWLSDYCDYQWQGRRILDLGCGSGYLCEKSLLEGASFACGVDMVVPTGYTPSMAWTFHSLDLDQSEWSQTILTLCQRKLFDAIFAFDILEHVSSPWNFLVECRKLLASEGILVVTTPNTSSWERWLRPRSWSGATDEQHKTLFHRYSLSFILERAGLEPALLEAPVRKLGPLAALAPQIGGQLFCVAGQPRNAHQ